VTAKRIARGRGAGAAMSFLDKLATSFGSAVGGDLNAQIESAKTEGQQIAAAVALWA